MRILIVKRDKIGDMLLMTPMLEHLRNSLPDAEIHVLANDYNAWVVTGNPFIDHLWIYPRTRHAGKLRPFAAIKEWMLTRQLRKMNFDAVIAAGGVVSPRAIARVLRLNGKRTIAYCAKGSPEEKLLSAPFQLSGDLHEVEANLHLLTALGVKMPRNNIWPRFSLAPSALQEGQAWIKSHGLESGFIVIGVNARREKRKPTHQQICSWAKAVHERYGLATILVWQPGASDSKLYPGDDERMEKMLHSLPDYIHPFRSADDIMPVLGLVWHARTTVVPDGGLAHLASVSPGGVLALFAETNISPRPENWRPYAPRGRYLEADKAVAELDDAHVLAVIDELVESYRMPFK